VTLQRSSVAPSASDAVHGQTTLHEQVSKYDPVTFQDTAASSQNGSVRLKRKRSRF
jgi:hypothetical protein